MRTPFIAELPNLTSCGESVYLGISHTLPPQERGVLVLPNFGGSPAFMPRPFNAERPNLACNTYGEGRF